MAQAAPAPAAGTAAARPLHVTRDIFVTFQNNVGPQGEAAPDGYLDSTVVEFTLSGREVTQRDLSGRVDGLTAATRS